MRAWEAFKALQEGTCKRVRDNQQRHWSWGEWGVRCEGSSVSFGPQYEPYAAAEESLTVEDVRNAVRDIAAHAPDFGMQHELEDELYVDVLAAIRDGHQHPRELAEEALKSKNIALVRAHA